MRFHLGKEKIHRVYVNLRRFRFCLERTVFKSDNSVLSQK